MSWHHHSKKQCPEHPLKANLDVCHNLWQRMLLQELLVKLPNLHRRDCSQRGSLRGTPTQAPPCEPLGNRGLACRWTPLGRSLKSSRSFDSCFKKVAGTGSSRLRTARGMERKSGMPMNANVAWKDIGIMHHQKSPVGPSCPFEGCISTAALLSLTTPYSSGTAYNFVPPIPFLPNGPVGLLLPLGPLDDK